MGTKFAMRDRIPLYIKERKNKVREENIGEKVKEYSKKEIKDKKWKVKKAEWQVCYCCTDISSVSTRRCPSVRKAGAHNRRMACNLIVVARLNPQSPRHFS